MQCQTCARKNGDDARFCAHCGAALASSAVETVAAPREAIASPPRSRRPPSTDPFGQARFIPGTMVAERYRIVALLGRGGMGEVYRAEDLKLGQAVALKFLPERLAKNPDRLARFHQEVRLARQIAHPNVCRVYDVGEADGQPYLSMEYVDGEDLSSLLRRIGRLPADKAVQLAKQLCAGLAAAHDRGVLHGDLKPANVLVDGRGRIRVADFGLAGLAEAPDETRGVIAGTPGYMAPEQLAGQGTSMRTDVYALGLVLYEMCTGKPALDRDGRPRQPTTGGSTITQPSEVIADLDPAIERIILRCLEEDPARRPPSAVSVAAALPGGDPLAAALAAGETPSPELVAAAGETGGISRLAAAVCLAVVVLGVAAVTWTSRRASVTAYVPLNANAHVMADRARATLETLGLFDPDLPVEYRYGPDQALLGYIRETDQSATRWDRLRSDRLTAIMFWYRQAPGRSVQDETRIDFVPYDAGTNAVSVVTDPRGRLTRLVADIVPETRAAGAGTLAPAPDWTPVFELAGLAPESFMPVPPAREPPVFVEDRRAWTGTLPDAARTPVRIEAGARSGVPVWFEILAPWTPEDPEVVPRPGEAVFFGFIGVVLVVSVGLARRNARMGRADRTGALRGAALLAVVLATSVVLTGRFGPTDVGIAFSNVIALWVFYMALEPYVRRFWPEILIGWRAMLAGRIRDPIVGRDLLAGIVAGVLLTLFGQVWFLRPWLALPPDVIPTGSGAPWGNLLLVSGGLEAFAYAVGTVYEALLLGLPVTVVLVLLTAGLGGRRRLGQVALFVLVLAIFVIPQAIVDEPINAAGTAVMAAALIFVLSRFGLLAVVAMYAPLMLLGGVAIRFDAPPYATASYVVVGVVGALALYGLHAALGGKSLFGDADSRDTAATVR